MITLAIDTCLAVCQVAILIDDCLVAQASEPMIRGHQERLAPMARDLMREARLDFNAINRIGVTVGPGSFTGLRVGLAFAKGLALALGRPCVGVETLVALAADGQVMGVTAAVIDAGRGNLYLQLFAGGRPISGPDILPIGTAAARLAEIADAGPLTLIGPGANLLSDIVADATCILLAAPSPEMVARLAAHVPPTPPRALYLRPPDAIPTAARIPKA